MILAILRPIVISRSDETVEIHRRIDREVKVVHPLVLNGSGVKSAGEPGGISPRLAEITQKPAAVIDQSFLDFPSAGEKTGQLGTLLTKAADFYDSEVDHDIGTLMSLFEPLMIIFIGLFIAFILIAMYMPLFDLINTL